MGANSIRLALAMAAILSSQGAGAESPSRSVTLVAPERLDQISAENPAGLKIDVLPSPEFAIGSKVSFRVIADKPGYLILIDVDSTGKVTQRYPNLFSMALPKGASENANLIQPGKAVAIPDLANPFAHFEYIAEPPTGNGMIIALLSPNAVHVVDLPDVPQELVGTRAAANFLFDAARNLRIAPRDAAASLADPHWSFAVKSYSITP